MITQESHPRGLLLQLCVLTTFIVISLANRNIGYNLQIIAPDHESLVSQPSPHHNNTSYEISKTNMQDLIFSCHTETINILIIGSDHINW
jgi:hypothetical protein